MISLNRLARRNLTHFAVAFIAAGTWLSGCGDDNDDGGDGGDDNNGGSSGSSGSSNGGSAGNAGNAGSMTGGTSPTGGSSGSGPTGGTAGSTTGGSAGTGGSATGGMAGEGTGGMGGEGMGGEGMGGEGGSAEASCTTQDLGISLVPANPMQAHDHLPLAGAARMTLLGMINTGSPLTLTMPSDGSNPHTHTLTFTAQQLTVLRNGGALQMNVTTAMGGPAENMHTHAYALECQP
ncbi:MAG TPA: hypothetical protein VFZ53_02195 [Polyangiaceae bacterium]